MAAFGLSEGMTNVSKAAQANRTVVCIYLMGGNDSNNMIVPLDSPAYDAYARGRGQLALAKDSLLPVQSGSSGNYGFHPKLPGLRDLYNQNALAVVANVGRVAPGRQAAGSSTDNSAEMQVRFLPWGYLAIPWAVPNAADSAAAQVVNLSHGVTVAGAANPLPHHRLDQPAGPVRSRNRRARTVITDQLNTVLEALKTGGPGQRAFMVPVGGFETKQDQLNRQADLFAELDSALVTFYWAVKGLGMSDIVTTYTDTEFNRTLAPNRTGGTDHAWGGHHLVLGGATLGGQIYGQFPSMEVGGADDASGNGTWAPSTSSAQYAATLASWWGNINLADVPEYAPSYRPDQPRLGFLAH